MNKYKDLLNRIEELKSQRKQVIYLYNNAYITLSNYYKLMETITTEETVLTTLLLRFK